MNIAFFSESNFEGKIPRDFINMSTEYAWYVALDVDIIGQEIYLTYQIIFMIWVQL